MRVGSRKPRSLVVCLFSLATLILIPFFRETKLLRDTTEIVSGTSSFRALHISHATNRSRDMHADETGPLSNDSIPSTTVSPQDGDTTDKQSTNESKAGNTTSTPSLSSYKPLNPIAHANNTAATSSVALCTRDQIINGRWVASHAEHPPYETHTVHLKCHSHSYYQKHGYHSYEWIPYAMVNDVHGVHLMDNTTKQLSQSPPINEDFINNVPTSEKCYFTQWDRDEFCRLTNITTISIIGDSLSWEQYASLVQLLKARGLRQTDQHVSRQENRNHVLLACSWILKDTYINKTRQSLMVPGATRIVFRNQPRLEDLADSIRHHFPQILILNRGAHYEPDEDLLRGIRDNIEVLNEWQNACRSKGIKCHLYWRTSVPGHPNCARAKQQEDYNQTDDDSDELERNFTHVSNYLHPVDDIRSMEELVEDIDSPNSRHDNMTVTFHWQDFQRQNNLILQELEQARLSHGLEFTVLDAYYLNIRRPDRHRLSKSADCLHNCYPGKMDVYNQLLLHYLKRDRTRADVSRLQELLENSIRQRQQEESLNRQRISVEQE